MFNVIFVPFQILFVCLKIISSLVIVGEKERIEVDEGINGDGEKKHKTQKTKYVGIVWGIISLIYSPDFGY